MEINEFFKSMTICIIAILILAIIMHISFPNMSNRMEKLNEFITKSIIEETNDNKEDNKVIINIYGGNNNINVK